VTASPPAEALLDLAMRIQQVPAPTFDEAQRAAFVRDCFIETRLSDVAIDDTGNVHARLAGSGGAPLVVSAHLDTVFSEGTDLKIVRSADRISGPGIGDNSLGVAALFGLAWLLRERELRPPGDLWLVANTCEEGLGDLRGMRAVVDRFGAAPCCYLVLEGMAFGHVYHRAIGVRRYRIAVHAAGGHAWSDYGRPSAIHELAGIVTALTSIELPSEPRTTMNVGRITGGTTVNTLAAEAWIELDLRSESTDVLRALVVRVETLVRRFARPGVEVAMDVIGDRPAGELPPDHPLIGLAVECLRKQGADATLTSGSTDANVPLSRGHPALALGITVGGGAHTTNEYILTEPVGRGMEQVFQFVTRVWR